MWNEKLQNAALSGQAMGPPEGFPGSYMDTKNFPPPLGSSDMTELSRKRKLTTMDQQSTFPGPRPEYNSFPRHSNLQNQPGPVFPPNIRGNNLGPHLNRPSWPSEQFTFKNELGNTNQNTHTSLSGKIKHSSFSLSPVVEVPIETHEVSKSKYSRPSEYNRFGLIESNISLLHQGSFNGSMQRPPIRPHVQDSVSLGPTNPVMTDKPPERPRHINSSQQNFVMPHGFSVDFDRTSSRGGPFKFGISNDLNQGGHGLSTLGANEISTVGPASWGFPAGTNDVSVAGTTAWGFPACIDKKENVRFSPIIGLGDVFKVQQSIIVNGTEGSDVESSSKHSVMEISPKNDVSSANDFVDRSHGSLKLDEKDESHARKETPTAEKLWDGTLQLSSTVTLSAVAFFKSGEKMPSATWSEFLEVKGKVRLEAFEKYIQELPRSRNRGLMVISLCWKEGSGETGLAGIKEVSKGYKQKEKVGFAQVCPGYDLYMCPHSDTIITILAKHGFFKGMAATEDNHQDSMIGCVVWKKNQTSSSSTSVLRKPEKKNILSPQQPLNSPCESSTHQVGENNNFLIKNEGENRSENEKNESSEAQVESKIETSLFQSSDSEKNATVLPPPSDVVKESEPSDHDIEDDDDDDDDLPEFDFGTACGVPQIPPPIPATPQPVTASNKKPALNSAPPVKACGPETNLPVKTPPPVPPPKNLFDDDDDDMPEWCPPELEINNQAQARTTRPVGPSPPPPPPPPPKRAPPPPPTSVPSQVPNQTFQTFPPRPPMRPPFPPPRFPNQLNVPQPRPLPNGYIQVGPTSSTGLIPNPFLRPPFNANLPFHRGGPREWRP